MTFFHAFLLGIVQGLTEFIPVSSTAHLLISQQTSQHPCQMTRCSPFLSLSSWEPLSRCSPFTGKTCWLLLMETLKNLGGLRNVQWTSAKRKTWLVHHHRHHPGIAGRLFVEGCSRSPVPPAHARSLDSLICRRSFTCPGGISRQNARANLNSMTWLDALIIGLMQVIAVFPGASRSGTTIAAACSAALTVLRRRALRFSCLCLSCLPQG